MIGKRIDIELCKSCYVKSKSSMRVSPYALPCPLLPMIVIMVRTIITNVNPYTEGSHVTYRRLWLLPRETIHRHWKALQGSRLWLRQHGNGRARSFHQLHLWQFWGRNYWTIDQMPMISLFYHSIISLYHFSITLS